MPENSAQKIKFQIELEDSDGEIYNEIQYISFVRTPIIKQGSFCIVRLSLPLIKVKQLQYLLASNIQDIWKMTIYTADDNKEDVKYDKIFEKNYQIISMQELEQITLTKNEIMVKMVLVNPILYTLSTTTMFNEILTETTAYDAIKKYEDFLNQKFGKFSFLHYGAGNEKNSFRYEQIFIPHSINTINVPKYIINTYKPFHSYSIYFFDDFYFSDKSEKEIVCHFLNLADIRNQYPNADIQEYIDYVQFTRRLTTREFNDPLRLLDKETFASIIFRTKDVVGELLKQMKSLVPQVNTNEVINKNILERDIKVTRSQLELAPQGQSARATIVYVPDNEKNAKERFKIARDLIFNKFEKLVIFETDFCLPYWLQFGYLYNLEPSNREEYKYTPISIVNTFRREKEKGIKLIHSCRYVMLKIILDENKYISRNIS